MRGKPNSEAGFTIVEVLVAILILTIGAMTTFSLLSAATRNAQRAKASQVALDYAEQELEYLRSLKDEELALLKAPQPSTNKMSPDYRVKNGTFALTRQPLGNYKSLVVNEGPLEGGGEVKGGTIKSGPEAFASGDVKGQVYRFIVWRNDPQCPETSCTGNQDYKQIVVAVKLDTPPSQAGERGYFEVQSNFIDPNENSESNPLPNANGSVVAEQFFLTDTPCSPTGTTVRQEITGNHLLHNTLGTCASGLQTGTTLGAPDALLIGTPPPDPDVEDPNNPPEYDYSNDFYLDTTPDAGTGVQIRKDDTTGCHYVPTGTSNPESQVHRWVTDPMPSNFVMSQKATLQFYTESLNHTEAPGKACIYLFKRHETGSPPVATDTLLTNVSGGTPYWTYTPAKGANWPSEWSKGKVRLTMSFNEAPYTIPAGDRLGVAISVERKETNLVDALAFMYDHPDRVSRLEVETSTPLTGG